MNTLGIYEFDVRSYECGPDGFVTLASVMNYLQESVAERGHLSQRTSCRRESAAARAKTRSARTARRRASVTAGASTATAGSVVELATVKSATGCNQAKVALKGYKVKYDADKGQVLLTSDGLCLIVR